MNNLLSLLLLIIPTVYGVDVWNVDQSIFQYSFAGPISPKWNQTLANITMQSHNYVEFGVTLTKDVFDRPTGQIDNIFSIGLISTDNNVNTNTLSAYIDINKKGLLITMNQNSQTYHCPSVLQIGQLYNLKIYNTPTNDKILINNKIFYNKQKRIFVKKYSTYSSRNQSLLVSDLLNNPANVILFNFSVITSNKSINDLNLANIKKYHSDIEHIDIKYWLKDSQISTKGINYFIDKEQMDGGSLLILCKQLKFRDEFISMLNEEKTISLKDRLRFEIALNKVCNNAVDIKPSEVDNDSEESEEEDTDEDDDGDSEEEQTVDVEVFEFGFVGPIYPSFNNPVINVTIYDNIYIEFDMIVSEQEFNKGLQIDNIFQIGSDYLGVFMQTTQKKVLFRFKQNNGDFIEIYSYGVRTDSLYHITIHKTTVHKTKTNLKININNGNRYNKAFNLYSTDVNQSLYISNSLNNAADVIISNFVVISANRLIDSNQIVNAKNFSKYIENDHNPIKPLVNSDSCSFKGSFEPIKGSIIDSVNIKSNIYMKFRIIFNKDYDEYTEDYNYGMDDDWSSLDYDNESEDESEDEQSNIFNIIHVGDSEYKYLPAIYFDNKNEIIIFRFGVGKNFIETYFKIERKVQYQIEIYKTNKRFQIAINKHIIYDGKSLGHNGLNQPVYISNPWQNTANVKISPFSIISSDDDDGILRGNQVRNYPYEYCLLLDGDNENGVQLDGVWKPNGTYNNHHLFIKKYIPEIGHPFIYLFYYLHSWRIYISPYNNTNPLNPSKWYLKCDIDTFNILLCSQHFKNNYKINKDISLISGDCCCIEKQTYIELEEENDYIYEEIKEGFDPPTEKPTVAPTLSPTLSPTKSIYNEIFWEALKGVCGILLIFTVVFIWWVVCILYRKIKKYIYPTAKVIVFPAEKYYQTNFKKDQILKETDAF